MPPAFKQLAIDIVTRLITAEEPLEFNQIFPWSVSCLRKRLLNELEDLDIITVYRQPNGRYLYEYNKQPLDNKESF